MRNLIKACVIGAILVAVAVPIASSKLHNLPRPYQKTGTEGTIRGFVELEGTPTSEKMIDVSADPACFKRNPRPRTEFLIVNKGKLANAFIYVKSGLPLDEMAYTAPSQPAVLDQQRCRFVPHVMGMQVGQTLEVRNSDPTTHNVHPTPRVNPEWNKSQAPLAEPLRSTFARAEVAVPIKCNQHPWMKAWVGVLPHPFFAVSNTAGAFEIAGLPPGDYVLAAWHEQFGEKTMNVTVPAVSAADARFSFNMKEWNPVKTYYSPR